MPNEFMNERIFFGAIKTRDYKTARISLTTLKPLDFNISQWRDKEENQTILHLLTRDKSRDACEFLELVLKTFNIEKSHLDADNKDFNALHTAIIHLNLNAVKLLIENDWNLQSSIDNWHDKQGQTLIHLLVQDKSDEVYAMIKLLLESCTVDPSQADEQKFHALHRAAICLNLKAVKLLIEHGWDFGLTTAEKGKIATAALIQVKDKLGKNPDKEGEELLLLIKENFKTHQESIRKKQENYETSRPRRSIKNITWSDSEGDRSGSFSSQASSSGEESPTSKRNLVSKNIESPEIAIEEIKDPETGSSFVP